MPFVGMVLEGAAERAARQEEGVQTVQTVF